MSETKQEKTFVVSLKGIAPRIAQVRYEKDRSDLKLHFVLHEGSEISSEAISLDVQGNSSSTPSSLEGNMREFLLNLLKSHENPQVRLLGAVLPKLTYVSHLKTFVAQLTKEDLLNAQTDITMLPAAVKELKDNFSPKSSFLILFDSGHNSQGILWSESPHLRNKLRLVAGGQEKGSWVLLSPIPLSSNQLRHAFLS